MATPIVIAARGGSSGKQKRHRLLILILGAAIVLAMTYGSGMMRQKRVLAAVQQDLKKVNLELRVAQLSLLGRELLLQQLEARRQVALAADASRSQNFGIARQRLAEAADRLEKAQSTNAAGVADLRAVTADVRTLSADSANVPSPDRLDEIARKMDTALGNVVPASGAVSGVTVPPPTANDVPIYPEVGR